MDIWSAKDYFLVTPADNTAIGDLKALYIGTAGTLKVRKEQGGTVFTFEVPAGAILPLKKIYSVESTDTTADNIYRLI